MRIGNKAIEVHFEPALSTPFLFVKSKPGAFRDSWTVRIWPFNISCRGEPKW